MPGRPGQRPIAIYWFGGGRGEINFGDSVSPLLVEAILGRHVRYAPVSRADMIGIGSVLDLAIQRTWQRKYFLRFHPLAVWGSGSIESKFLDWPCRLSIASVRGQKTRDAMSLHADCKLSDPGLLCSELWPSSQSRSYRWGIVPHVSDRKSARVAQLINETQRSVMVDLGSPDLKATAKLIASCEFVVSSSLHGLVVADSYGIPAIRADFGSLIKGGDWKFNDYFSTVSLQREKIDALRNLQPYEKHMERVEPSCVARLQETAREALLSIEM
jgi:pyruvyltransferase